MITITRSEYMAVSEAAGELSSGVERVGDASHPTAAAAPDPTII